MADQSKECGLSISGPEDDRSTIAVFASVAAIAMSVVYFVARTGFRDNPPIEVLSTLSVSFFLLLLPQGYRIGSRMLGRSTGGSWLSSDAGLSLIALLALPIAGIAGSRLGVNVLPAVMLMGFIFFAATLVHWLAKGSFGRSVLFLAWAVLFGLWLGFAVWGTGWQSPLFEEALAGGYYLCKDILVTSGITGILRTYGVPSTGLDGIPYCWYHWGAYWFFAWISEMEKIRVIRFMQLGFPVIFLPFLVSRFLEFGIHAREVLSPSDRPGDLRRDGVFWLVFAFGWIGFIPLEVAQKIPLGTDIILYSESYVVGAACSFLVLSLTLGVMRRAAQRPDRSLSVGDHCLLCLLPLMCAGIGVIKISQMFLLVLLYGYLFLRLKGWKFITPLLSLVACVVLLPVVVKLTSPGGAAGGYGYLYPMAFFVSLVPLAWKPFFFLLFYFWPWVYLISYFYWQRTTTIAEAKNALLGGKLIPVELMVVLCIVGSAPAFILPIGGGSGFFFMDFQCWLALALILGERTKLREMSCDICGVQERALGWEHLQLRKLFALLVVLCFLGSTAANGIQAVWRMVSQNVAIRTALLHPNEDDRTDRGFQERWYKSVVKGLKKRSVPDLKQFVSDELKPLISDVQDRLEQGRSYPVIAAFRELDALPVAEKRKTLIYIPRSNRVFWDMLSMCDAVPLIVPALTGTAMIDGLPDRDCKTNLGHFDMYPARGAKTQDLDQAEGMLCAAVRAKGFSSAMVVIAGKENNIKVDRRDCP